MSRRSRPQPLDLTSVNNINNFGHMSNLIAVASSPLLIQQAAAQLSANLMRHHYQQQNSPYLHAALLSALSPALTSPLCNLVFFCFFYLFLIF